MVAAEQNLGDFPAPEVGWTGVLRAIKQARVSVKDSYSVESPLPSTPGREAGDAVDDQCRAELRRR